jgi:hypothetical protein
MLVSWLGLVALVGAPNACSSDSSSKGKGEAGQGGETSTSGGESSTSTGGSQSGGAGKAAAAGTAAGGASGGADSDVTSGGAPEASAGADPGSGGEPQAAGGASGASGAAGAGGADGCNFGEAASAGTDQALNLFGEVVYFANGAELPAGHYRVSYVDGCMKYASSQDWTIHAYDNGSYGWWLVGDATNDKIVLPPGTVGYSTANGAYATFDECVAANLLLPPVEFDFAGGKLGVWLQVSPYSDNLAGEDNRNPKWNLVRLDCQ